MNSNSPTEHFVTLFDSHYLPQGLCLHRSLEEQAQPFHLWIVAVDDACADAVTKIRLRHVTVVRLREVENDALRSVKSERSVGEYCWTLTPFLPSHVFGRAPAVERITYLDADLYFFQRPSLLIDELLAAGKHVLVTEHAFAPEYAANIRFGRFCVQFVTFRNSEPAKRILADWQRRCIDWCFAREEDGKFGDQKYLDEWPQRFPADVHILSRADRTLAPWNVLHVSRRCGEARPALYHFHGLKVVSGSKVVLYHRYRVGGRNQWIYDRYVSALQAAVREMRRLGIPVVARPMFSRWRGRLYFVWALLARKAGWANL